MRISIEEEVLDPSTGRRDLHDVGAFSSVLAEESYAAVEGERTPTLSIEFVTPVYAGLAHDDAVGVLFPLGAAVASARRVKGAEGRVLAIIVARGHPHDGAAEVPLCIEPGLAGVRLRRYRLSDSLLIQRDECRQFHRGRRDSKRWVGVRRPSARCDREGRKHRKHPGEMASQFLGLNDFLKNSFGLR